MTQITRWEMTYTFSTGLHFSDEKAKPYYNLFASIWHKSASNRVAYKKEGGAICEYGTGSIGGVNIVYEYTDINTELCWSVKFDDVFEIVFVRNRSAKLIDKESSYTGSIEIRIDDNTDKAFASLTAVRLAQDE